jgi:hypothetical protein
MARELLGAGAVAETVEKLIVSKAEGKPFLLESSCVPSVSWARRARSMPARVPDTIQGP